MVLAQPHGEHRSNRGQIALFVALLLLSNSIMSDPTDTLIRSAGMPVCGANAVASGPPSVGG